MDNSLQDDLKDLAGQFSKTASKKRFVEKDLAAIRVIHRRLGEMLPGLVNILSVEKSREKISAPSQKMDAVKVNIPSDLKFHGKQAPLKKIKIKIKIRKFAEAALPKKKPVKKKDQLALEFSGESADQVFEVNKLRDIAQARNLPLPFVKKVWRLAGAISLPMSMESTKVFIRAEMMQVNFRYEPAQLDGLIQKMHDAMGLKIKKN